MKSYLITSDNSSKALCKKIKKYNPEYILYRNKESLFYRDKATRFVEICSKFSGIKVFLHQDFELASKLHVEGVHLTSTQFTNIKEAKALGLEVIISTHTELEVLKAQEEGADYVSYSPIFITPHKGEAKGIINLINLLSKCTIKVFALGGIVSEKELEVVAKTNVYGFASIRYFEDD